MHKFLGHVVVDDGDVLRHGVVNLPGRGLHLRPLGTHHHLHVFSAQAAGCPATVHGRITAPEHEDSATDLAEMLKSNGSEPVNADMNVLGGLFSPGNREITAPGRTGPHKDGVVILLEHRAKAVYVMTEVLLNPQLQNEAHFFVEDLRRQAEHGNLTAHEAPGQGLVVEEINFVAKGREVSRHRQGGRASPNERHPPLLFDIRRHRHGR